MMTDESAQRAADAEANKSTYSAVMRGSAEFGVPFSLGLTMFFTQLVMASGIATALVASILTYIAVLVIVKMFFSH